jgi:hypothetical protein
MWLPCTILSFDVYNVHLTNAFLIVLLWEGGGGCSFVLKMVQSCPSFSFILWTNQTKKQCLLPTPTPNFKQECTMAPWEQVQGAFGPRGLWLWASGCFFLNDLGLYIWYEYNSCQCSRRMTMWNCNVLPHMVYRQLPLRFTIFAEIFS